MNMKCEKVTDHNNFKAYNSGCRRMDVVQLGIQIRKARKKAGLTQDELADRIGLSQSYVAKLERGGTDNPGSQAIMKIAESLGVTPGWLYFNREDIDDLDDESLDVAVLFNKLPPSQRQAIKLMVDAVSEKFDHPAKQLIPN